jgi:hypothetical protein
MAKRSAGQRYVELKSVTRSLVCKLTRDELLERADDLSSVVQQIAVEENRQTEVKQQLKSDMAALVAQQSKLASIVRGKEEFRDIDCRQTLDVERAMVSVVRADSGEEIATRNATVEEMQRHLPLEPVTA